MVERLRAGSAFHRDVQVGFVAGLLGATAAAEEPIRLVNGRNGRIDLLVIPFVRERMAVVVEVKNTDWDGLLPHRVRPNVRRHMHQLQAHLDPIVEELGTADGYTSVCGVLLCRRRPGDPAGTDLVTGIADRESLMVVWHEDTTWSASG